MSALTYLLEPTTFLTGVVFALSILWFLSKRRPAGLPPSPGLALPFIGHLHLLDKDPRVSFAKWRQKYGDVFSLYMGGSLVIVLSGYDVIKEALMKYGDALSDRPHSFVADYVSKNKGAGLLNFFPLLHYLPGDLFKSKLLIANITTVDKTLIVPQIEKHRNEYHEDDASDFIHIYLRQITKKETKGLPTSVNETNLIRVLSELFGAGTETTATAILWALVFFLHYPEVQEKCYEEIKRVVGTERAPTIHDKPEMTYNEATSMEVLRRGNIVPLSVPHCVAYDVTFKGYNLPKGATVFPVLESVLYDTATWGDPLIFRPDRFIGPDGKLTRPEEFLPFSIGRRICLGEALAKVELFLYLTTMIQRFRFVSPENEALPPLEGVLVLTLAPKPFKICALPRDYTASE